MLLQENYPQLKSNESFLKLQDTIEGTENRLSVERGRYNEAVRALNLYTQTFPNKFFAELAGVRAGRIPQSARGRTGPPKIDFSKP